MEDKQNQWENNMAPNTHYWPCLKNGRGTDKWEYISALFMDLSRSFDTINQDLMPTKQDGMLLFNLFIKDLVLSIQYTLLSNYADDNALLRISSNLHIKKQS